VFIKKGLIGNSDDLITTAHPIWCNEGRNRIKATKIPKVKK